MSVGLQGYEPVVAGPADDARAGQPLEHGGAFGVIEAQRRAVESLGKMLAAAAAGTARPAGSRVSTE